MEYFRGTAQTPWGLLVLVGLLLTLGRQPSVFAAAPVTIALEARFSELSPADQTLFWRWREEFSQYSQELAQPLGQLRPERRAEIFQALEKEITHSEHTVRQLGATLALFYAHKGPQRELGPLLQTLIFSKGFPQSVRWVAAVIWTSHGGPHLSRSKRKELGSVINEGIRTLARECSALPEDPSDLDTAPAPYRVSAAALWLLDDPWVKWLSPSKLPELTLSAHLELGRLTRFASALRNYRRWKAQLREAITPGHRQYCARALLTDAGPEDSIEEQNPFSRR